MKAIIFKWVMIAIAIVIVSIVITKHDTPPPPVVPDVEATQADSAKTAQTALKIAKQDSLINALEVRLVVTVATAKDLKAINKGLKQDVDTLRKYYRVNHNLQTCDSMVNLQQNYIASIVDELDSLDSEAEQYSRLLYEQRIKTSDKDTIINSHQRLIDKYKQQFSEINCMSDWTRKHKFWSWILNIKCDPL